MSPGPAVPGVLFVICVLLPLACLLFGVVAFFTAPIWLIVSSLHAPGTPQYAYTTVNWARTAQVS